MLEGFCVSVERQVSLGFIAWCWRRSTATRHYPDQLNSSRRHSSRADVVILVQDLLEGRWYCRGQDCRIEQILENFSALCLRSPLG